MRCLADFVLDSDLCLPPDVSPLTLRSNGFSLVLSNASGGAIPGAVLSAQLIFGADSFENIRTIAQDKFARALNVLAYTTNRKFKNIALKRVIDWTPGIVERRAMIYNEVPMWDQAEPRLDGTFVDTASRLLAMHAGEEQHAAMRWYRRGIEAEVLEDQFSYFWFALEIAAQALKGPEKVPSRCPKCLEPLFCTKCDEHPMHRRYPGEVIQQIVEQVHPKNAKEIFEALQLIRHTLMHGGRIASVVDKLPCNEEQAVNKLAFVTWQAIHLMFDKSDPQPETPLSFGYTDNIVRRTLVATVEVSTTLLPSGDPNNPKLADFPHMQLDLVEQPHKPLLTGADPHV